MMQVQSLVVRGSTRETFKSLDATIIALGHNWSFPLPLRIWKFEFVKEVGKSPWKWGSCSKYNDLVM